MRLLGGELFPRGVDAIVITHQHGDHIAHLEPLARALRVPVFLHHGVTATRARQRFDVRAYAAGDSFAVGALEVSTLSVPHDAPQVAVRVGLAEGALRFGLATDLGHVPAALVPFLAACDEVLIEANYCPDMMRDGPYPPHLKKRVTGDFGHLANEQTAALAASLVDTRVRRLWLGHLSRVNNTPGKALGHVTATAAGMSVEVIEHGEPKVLDIVARSEVRARPGQLGLPFG
jgi:phosphoribosyl 1,2-cyclic phosphodiesterase